MPFDLNIANLLYLKQLQLAVDHIDGVTCVADDVSIYSSTEEDHDVNLRRSSQCYFQKHIWLKHEKVELLKRDIIFHRRILILEGVKVNPGKLMEMQAMPLSKDEGS